MSIGEMLGGQSFLPEWRIAYAPVPRRINRTELNTLPGRVSVKIVSDVYVQRWETQEKSRIGVRPAP